LATSGSLDEVGAQSISGSLQNAVSELSNSSRESPVHRSGTTASFSVNRGLDLKPFEDLSSMELVVLSVGGDRTRGSQRKCEWRNLQIRERMVRRQAPSIGIANILNEVNTGNDGEA